eukprot:7389796-Prymnesium_polylepis.1
MVRSCVVHLLCSLERADVAVDQSLGDSIGRIVVELVVLEAVPAEMAACKRHAQMLRDNIWHRASGAWGIPGQAHGKRAQCECPSELPRAPAVCAEALSDDAPGAREKGAVAVWARTWWG